jgi:hypothetical protein
VWGLNTRRRPSQGVFNPKKRYAYVLVLTRTIFNTIIFVQDTTLAYVPVIGSLSDPLSDPTSDICLVVELQLQISARIVPHPEKFQIVLLCLFLSPPQHTYDRYCTSVRIGYLCMLYYGYFLYRYRQTVPQTQLSTSHSLWFVYDARSSQNSSNTLLVSNSLPDEMWTLSCLPGWMDASFSF